MICFFVVDGKFGAGDVEFVQQAVVHDFFGEVVHAVCKVDTTVRFRVPAAHAAEQDLAVGAAHEPDVGVIYRKFGGDQAAQKKAEGAELDIYGRKFGDQVVLRIA